MRGGDKLRIWPAYFNTDYSRGQGRRVSRNIAIRDPKADAILKASEKLGLNPILKSGAYSKHPWRITGLVLVDKKGSKTKILRDIATQLRTK